jgi:Flp pilus assembly protein TadG
LSRNRTMRMYSKGRRQESRKRRGEWGQSLVETAAILPILALLLGVVVDASRAFDAAIVLTNAVRQGARYASLEPSPSSDDIRKMVVEDIEGSGTNVSDMSDFGTKGTVTLDWTSNPDAVKVTASYDFPLWFGGILGIPTLNLERSAVIRHTEEVP